MTKDEALKLALEALIDARTNDDSLEKWDRNKKAITVCEQALAAQQEPDLTDADRKTYQAGHNAGVAHHKQATKREWVGLTDEEVKHEWEVWRASLPRYIGFAKGIEDMLKEKNT